MMRQLLVFTLVIAVASVANAAVVWDYTGAGSTDPLDWYDNGNWTVTGTTSYPNNPCEQYSGTAPASGPPDYRYINDDATAINIGGSGTGYTVNKTVNDGTTFLTSDCLYMGGSNCVLTLDDASTLNLGDDLFAGVDGATATVKVLGGSTLNTVESRIGNAGSTGTVTVDGSTYNATGQVLVGYGAGADGTLELKNSSVANLSGWMRLGYAASDAQGDLIVTDSTMTLGSFLQVARGGTGTLTATNSTISAAREFLVGYLGTSSGEATLTSSTLSTNAYWRVASETGSTGDVTLTNSTISVGQYAQIGRKGTATLTATGSTINVAQDSTATYSYFATAYFAGSGTVSLDDTALNVGIAPDGVTVTHTAGDVFVGRAGTGVMSLTNGSTLTLSDDLTVAYTGGNGTLNVDASSVTVVGDDIYVANRGTAEVNVTNGGSFGTNGDALMIALGSAGAVGTVNASGGSTIFSAGRTYVGSVGTATLDLTDSTLNVGLDLRVSHGAASKGTLNIDGNSVLNIGRDFETNADAVVKDAGGGLEAIINMVDGDVNIDGYCALGDKGQGGAYTEFIMDAGTVDIGLDPDTPDPPLDFLDSLIMGWYDTDVLSYLTINGGVMTVHGEIRMGMTTDHAGDPIVTTGTDQGELRINIAGGTLQAEDYIDAGTITDHLITLTAGYLRINGTAVSEADMLALVQGPDISCPNGYSIYTDGAYTVLTIPEPATMTMILLGLCSLALIRRKKG